MTAPIGLAWLYTLGSRVPEGLRGSFVEWYERVQNIKGIFSNVVKKFFTQLCPSLL